MSEHIEKVTAKTIALDVEYKPYPGLKYEVAPDVVGTLKPAYEGLIEEYDAMRDRYGVTEPPSDEDVEDEEARRRRYRESEKLSRDATVDMAALVLTFDDGFDLKENRKSCIFTVVDRASEDFFIIKNPKPSVHMRSYMEDLIQLKKAAEGAGQDAPANGASSQEQTTSES